MRFKVECGYPLAKADSILNMYADYKVYIRYKGKLLPVKPGIELSDIPCTYADIRAEMNEGLCKSDGTPIGLQQAAWYSCSHAVCDKLSIYCHFDTIVVDTTTEQVWLIPEMRKGSPDYDNQIKEILWYADAIDFLDERLSEL